MAEFSIIVPTFTGQAYIEGMFESLLSQTGSTNKYEIVVVIDGPNKQLRTIVDRYKKIFSDRKIEFRVNQFKANQGRFRARFEGAKMAKFDHLLFVDDRITMETNYLSSIAKPKHDAAMPNVLETGEDSTVARLMYLIRRRAYGDKWGEGAKSFVIDSSNFEKSPKGTTSLWVKKELFLEACQSVSKQLTGDGKEALVSDDTQILKYIVESGAVIHKNAKAVITYRARTSSRSELSHLYKRGLRFPDYYFKRGTRFFPYVVVCCALAILALALAVINPNIFLAYICVSLGGLLVASIYLAERASDVLLVLCVLPLSAATFGFGVVRGGYRRFIK